MALFAKLFEVNKGKSQVLVTKEYDDEEESFTIKLRSDIPLAQVAIHAGYNSEEDRDAKFKEISQEMADEFFETNVKYIAQAGGEDV